MSFKEIIKDIQPFSYVINKTIFYGDWTGLYTYYFQKSTDAPVRTGKVQSILKSLAKNGNEYDVQ